MNEPVLPEGLNEEMLVRLTGPLLAAAENAGLGVSVSVLDGGELRRIYVSTSAARTLGYDAADLVGSSTFLTFAPEEVGRIEQMMRDSAQGVEVPRVLEAVILRKDGTRVPVEIAYSPVTLDGKVATIAFLRDITERKRTESALLASEALFRKLIEAAPEAVLVMRGLQVVYANPRYLSLMGYARIEQMKSTHGLEMLHPDDRAMVAARQQLILAANGPVAPLEYRALRRDGSTIWIECASLPIEFEGSPAILTFIRDVTERKASQALLIQTDRMATIGALAAGVAHELNNPLAYVLLNLGLFERELGMLVSDPDDRERIKSRLRTLQEGAERMAAIVRELRSFSRPNADALRAIDLRLVLESAINMAMNELKDRARIVRDYASVPHVVTDGARLGQVVLNLLLNAAQALAEGDFTKNEVRVTLRMDGEMIRVEVADSGPGIAPDILGRIFEPFFTTKPAGVGTGLGLSISQTIVTSMQGELTVESEIGRGTTFVVRLPLLVAPASATDALEEEASPPPRSGRAPRVLIVDDEIALATALKKVLELGHTVTAVYGGQAALDLLLDGDRFDVVLCDVLMPGTSGIDLYREIARQRPEVAPRIIFMSGASSMPRVAEFFGAIPNERIDKPLDLVLLRSLIQQIAAIREERAAAS